MHWGQGITRGFDTSDLFGINTSFLNVLFFPLALSFSSPVQSENGSSQLGQPVASYAPGGCPQLKTGRQSGRDSQQRGSVSLLSPFSEARSSQQLAWQPSSTERHSFSTKYCTAALPPSLPTPLISLPPLRYQPPALPSQLRPFVCTNRSGPVLQCAACSSIPTQSSFSSLLSRLIFSYACKQIFWLRHISTNSVFVILIYALKWQTQLSSAAWES